MVEELPADVPDAELAVLRVLWERGPSNRRQIAELLYPGGGPSHYATVQQLLKRLEAKGHVTSRRDGVVRTFAAAVAREQLINRRLREVADKLCGGSLTPLLMHLVKAGPLSAEELRQLRSLVRELGQTESGKKPR
jgi:predicted transcriptional regulator